jgi:hypothetical protein
MEVSGHLCSVSEVCINVIESISHIGADNAVADSESVTIRSEHECPDIDESCKL